MTIGVVSDSHHKLDYLKEAIDFLKAENCEYLFHSGDICTKDALELLKNSGLKYIAVFGNNDNSLLPYSSEFNIKKEPYYFKIEDVSFKIMHLPYFLNPDTNIIISGHTHKFHCEYINNRLFLNPGEICAREKPVLSFAKLKINPNNYIITHYFRNTNENNFMKEEFKYVK